MDEVLPRVPDPAEPAHLDELALLDRWVAAGYISATQAELIRDAEALHVPPGRSEAVEPHPSERATSLVLEALGYLGGVLMVAASGLLVAQFWDQLGLSVRIGLMTAVWLVLTAAGLAVPAALAAQGSRVRSALWLGGAAALAFALAITGDEWFGWADDSTAVLVGCGTGVLLGALWWRERSALLQAGLLIAAVVSVLALLGRFTSLDGPAMGVAVWLVGLAWWTLGVLRRLAPPRAATVLGPLAALVGMLMASMARWGIGLGLVTVAAFLVLAVRRRDLWLLVIAAVGALNLVPRVVEEWFPGRLAAPLVLLFIGLVMVLAAVRIGRRPARR